MARIRTIKPAFFTSDDICSLTPLARLLYIALWGESDREGRLTWKPREFKRKYLPEDVCDAEKVAHELVTQGLVVLYGDALAYIPTFLKHQVINLREAQSRLPAPDEVASPVTHVHARALPDMHMGKGKEGKGKEGVLEVRPQRAFALPEDWQPNLEDMEWAAQKRPDLTAQEQQAETERFKNHAKANNRTAFKWSPNWRNWISKAIVQQRTTKLANGYEIDKGRLALPGPDGPWRVWLSRYKPGDPWDENLRGARPESETENAKIPDVSRKAWRTHHGLSS